MTEPAFRYQVGGSLTMDFPGYVERRADRVLVEKLLKGETCIIFNSRQMGKSSLKVRAMQQLHAEGRLCAEIDPQGRGTTVTEEQWYAGTVKRLIEDFALEEHLLYRNWWNEQADPSLSPLERFFEFIDKLLLPATEAPLVIFVEEVDKLQTLQFDTDGFFSLIRSLYERRGKQPIYKRLSFALLGVATPYELIKDEKHAPFNIGYTVELTGFTLEEARPLLAGLEGRVADPEAALDAAMKWSRGQPFLTQKLLDLLLAHPQGQNNTEEWVAEVVQRHIIDAWEAKDNPIHLRHIRDRLLSHDRQVRKRLLRLTQKILESKDGIYCNSSREQMLLRLSGLAAPRLGMLQIYNPIYEAVFNQDWVIKQCSKLSPWKKIAVAMTFLGSLTLLSGLIWWQWDHNKSTLALIEEYCESLSRDSDPHATCGETDLMKSNFPDSETIKRLFNSKQYNEAVTELEKMINTKAPNANPSHLIALNNARILSKKSSDQVYAIAISLPFDQSVESIVTSLLAGVAEAQDKHNKSRNSFKLFIILSNDSNRTKDAGSRAEEFARKRFILSLFSSYSSELTFAHLKALQGKDLPLISATGTASLRSFNKEYEGTGNGKLDTHLFFRSVSTTETGAKHLVSRISKFANPAKTTILVFYQDSDLFSKSYLYDFLAEIGRSGVTIKGKFDLDEISDAKILQEVAKFKQQQGLESVNKLIAIIPDAFREQSARSKIGVIIFDANKNGELPIAGSNTLYGDDILNGDTQLKIIGVKGMPSMGEKIIANVPWYPDDNSQKTYRWSVGKLGWHYGTAYDATTMLLQAIMKLIEKREIVSRETIAKELGSGKIKIAGKTGFFSLKGSERDPQQSLLVSPQCINDVCDWKIIDKMPQ